MNRYKFNKWFEFYKNRVNNLSYEDYFKNKYEPFLNYLKNNIKSGMKVGEFGCGTSLVTKLLYRDKTKFKVIDNNSKMLELTSINLNNNKVEKKLHSIKQELNEKFDLIYSHGVLEHFNNHDIKMIIKNQLKFCNHLIHYVPSCKYKKPSFGDERLMSITDWMKIANPKGIVTFNCNYDLMLIWR